MKETTTTSIFVSVALLLAILAFALSPRTASVSSNDWVGKPLFEKFTDPLAVKSLEIIRFSESKNDIERFRIAEHNGLWGIPSHENYPADAKDQMAAVASALIDLQVLSVATAEGNSQSGQSLQSGQVARPDLSAQHSLYGVIDPAGGNLGLGEGVGMRIVLTGKDDQPLVDLIIGKPLEGNESVRYVRVSGSEPVFTVEIPVERFSTKFEDWIEKNLLDINPWDIRSLIINDYYVDTTRGALTYRGINEVAFDPDAPHDQRWSLKRHWKSRGGQFYEEPLPVDRELNKAAIETLAAALGDLKIVDVSRKPEFVAAPLRKSEPIEPNLESSEALASVGFYFNNVASPHDEGSVFMLVSNEGELNIMMKDGVTYILRFGQLTNTESETLDELSGEKKMALNRYLFIMAVFDDDAFPPPELLPVPGLLPDGMATPEEVAERDAEIKRIERSNQIKQDRHDEVVAGAKNRVEQLNTRFADWFYIISEDVYKKIHIDRESLLLVKTELPTPQILAPTKPQPVRELPSLPGMSGFFPIFTPEELEEITTSEKMEENSADEIEGTEDNPEVKIEDNPENKTEAETEEIDFGPIEEFDPFLGDGVGDLEGLETIPVE